MNKHSRIYIAGHNGMVGSAILRAMKSEGFEHLITRSSKELDLRDGQAVATFFKKEQPEYVFVAAAKVGGIHANNIYRADFIYDNTAIAMNTIHQSHLHGVKKLLFLGSTCIYPRLSEQPIKEEYLLSGFLEPTNEPYAIAKIAGIKLCEAYYDQYGCNFIAAMPTNLYGENDNFDLQNSHVLPALLRKFHEAKINNARHVEIWGNGTPLREFLHVDDLADACIFMMKHYNDKQFLNVGYGEDISIKDLALLIKKMVNFGGDILFDESKPNGTPKKLVDSSRLNTLGWKPKISLEEGIARTYKWYTSTQQ